MKSFALSSCVPGVAITAAHALAFERSLRRLEAWWKPYLTGTPFLGQDIGAAWEHLENVGLAWSPDLGAVPEDVEAAVVQLVEDLPDAAAAAAGDVAYHTLDDYQRPVCYVSYRQCQGSWPSAMMHELHESRVDPVCSAVATLPIGALTSLEVCDWVQGSDYLEVGCPGILLANAVGPDFFLQGSKRTEGLDIASDLRPPSVTAAFAELAGGYHNSITGGTESFVFGERVHTELRARVERLGVRHGKRGRP